MTFDPAINFPTNFLWKFEDGIATITLNRPDRKNPLTFESYDELRDTFRALNNARGVKVVVIRGAGEISALAATCTRSSARLPRWIATGC